MNSIIYINNIILKVSEKIQCIHKNCFIRGNFQWENRMILYTPKEAVALATASFVEYFLYVSRMPQRSCHSGRIPYMLKQSSGRRICCLEVPGNVGVMIPPNCLVEQRNQFHRF